MTGATALRGKDKVNGRIPKERRPDCTVNREHKARVPNSKFWLKNATKFFVVVNDEELAPLDISAPDIAPIFNNQKDENGENPSEEEGTIE